MTIFTVEVESDYIRMGESRRPTPSHRLNAYCTVIVRVSYGYGYTRGSGRVWVDIFGAGRVRVRVASSATGTGRVAEMVDPHTPTLHAFRTLMSAKRDNNIILSVIRNYFVFRLSHCLSIIVVLGLSTLQKANNQMK